MKKKLKMVNYSFYWYFDSFWKLTQTHIVVFQNIDSFWKFLQTTGTIIVIYSKNNDTLLLFTKFTILKLKVNTRV